ncbi:MAG: pyridoxal-phosphate dependent enzyme [Anaerolineales bacterium]
MTPTFHLECLDCGELFHGPPHLTHCPSCGGEWLEARYELRALAPTLHQRASGRPFDMWRYLEVLPITGGRPTLSMGEGGTSLILAEKLGLMLGLPHLYIKDERQGPTGSFKDRQAALTLATLIEGGQTEAVVASTGNVAIAFSAYGARTGVKIWAFLTSLVPAAKMNEVALYGTQVVKVTSTYDQAKALAAEFARERDLYLDRGARSIAAVEAMKTLAYEIAEQLGAGIGQGSFSQPAASGWRAPDWYIQAVSGGIGPIGTEKGFRELYQAGFIEKMPAIGVIQAEGCSPMVRAWKQGDDIAAPIEVPTTHISTLSTGDPGRSYSLLRQRMLAGGGGEMESVTDEEAFRAMHLLAKMEGLSVEPAAAVAVAGLIKLVRSGRIDRQAFIVINCSGHTVPVEEQLLGNYWTQEIELGIGQLPEVPREGLLAALERLDKRRTSDVLIVDDHADARRLVRRILQAQGDFIVREADSGSAALEMAQSDCPDLIILDLMMPEMDGFAVIEQLRANERTSQVPLIVITAKNLTGQEKKRLEGQISKLMLKGDFLNEDLMDEINSVLD